MGFENKKLGIKEYGAGLLAIAFLWIGYTSNDTNIIILGVVFVILLGIFRR